MRVFFIGASKFGARCLETLISLAKSQPDLIQVVGALTAPQTFSISYRPEGVKNVLHADISGICTSNDIPVMTITNGMNDQEILEGVKKLKPDCFIVCGWYHMLNKQWLAMAPAYGLHASLLPDYSGGAPLVWAIINDEKKTGISFFKFDTGIDNGDIVMQMETPIHEDDTIGTLYARIEDLGLSMVRQTLPDLARGTAKFTAQDHSQRRVFLQRTPEDGLIDWSKTTRCLYNFIRAQTKPYGGAFYHEDGKKVSIWRAAAATKSKSQNDIGAFYIDEGRVYVSCADGAIEILDISVDGVDASPIDFYSTIQTKVN